MSQDLTESNLRNLEAQLNSERLRKITSRRSVQSGGGLNAGELKRKIQERNLKEARLNVQKAEKKVQTAIKSAEKVTKEAGVAIRKLKKAYREEQKKRPASR